MHRSTLSKGQWFMISAVILSSIFLTISVMLKEYKFIDASAIAGRDENFYFHNLAQNLNRTVYYSPGCENLTLNINEMIYFEKIEMAKKGYIVDVYYTILDCNSPVPENRIRFDLISLASDKMQVWQGQLPEIS